MKDRYVKTSTRLLTSSLLLLSFTASQAMAHVSLSVEGNYFLVNGQPRFLVFISYFDALDSNNYLADLAYLKSKGFDGVRIFPNWYTTLSDSVVEYAGDTLIRADGNLNTWDTLVRLRWFLDAAQQTDMVVDISFSAETVPDLNGNGPAALAFDQLKQGLQAAASALMSYRGVIFDIQNESTHVGPCPGRTVRPFSCYGLTDEQVRELVLAVRGVDGGRIITASTEASVTAVTSAARSYYSFQDVSTHHESRNVGSEDDVTWYNDARTTMRINALGAYGKPVYLQEPPHVDVWGQYDANIYFTAASNAKARGAAAWTFHNRRAYHLNGTRFLTVLQSLPAGDPERTFIDGFDAVLANVAWGINPAIPSKRISLRTGNNTNYVVAEGGGGGSLYGDRTSVGPWEIFEFNDFNGGELRSGDLISLKTYSGNFLRACGNDYVSATAMSESPCEKFYIFKIGGGGDGAPLFNGDRVWLMSTAAGGHWYWGTDWGGGPGTSVYANRTAPGWWEEFMIIRHP